MPRSGTPTKAGQSALEALVDAAAGILAADSLEGTLGRIAHHLAALVPHDDLTVYEIDMTGTLLRPVFAVGNWVDEVMADVIRIQEGVTGWAVRNRRTRNVANSVLDPLCDVIPGTAEEPEALVAVPLIAHDRVVGSLNVYRSGADVAFTDAEVELVERFATMAALAYDSARQRETLREEANTDGLTGLLNHRGSQERLRRELVEAGPGTPVSVVVLDLDHFKRINDTYGHAEGDQALAAAAAQLRSISRDGDAVGRLGGEEFVIVLPGVDADTGREAAERARAAVAEVLVGGRPLACSAGLASFPDDARDAAELLACADSALYAAKDAGRGRTCRYGRSLARKPSPGEQRDEIEALLRDPAAIAPVFQPVLELATGRISGYEALARMPGQPSRPPDQWFAQAHRAGLGIELEAAALRAALAVEGRPPGTFLALNVSPRALVSGPVRDVLPEDLSSVVVELTEHELFGAEESLDACLVELRSRGARVALDDAGAGYAGLQQLIRVAPDILKLDRSLVHGAHADGARLRLLEALITFAGTTGAAVCGEGIEDLADLRALATLDATYAQGYALGRPAAPWPALAPGASAAAASPIEHGVRIASGSGVAGTWSRALGELAADLARAGDVDALAGAGRRAARLLGADDVALMRLCADGDAVELLSEHLTCAPGDRWRLSDYPATRHLMDSGRLGQIVAGDLSGDPAELAALGELGMGAMLIVPTAIGPDARGLIEVYRVRPQAFTSTQIDRARVVSLQFGAVLSRLAG